MPKPDKQAAKKQRQKNIASAIRAGGEINISKASTSTLQTISNIPEAKQRGKAKQEVLRRATTGEYR